MLADWSAFLQNVDETTPDPDLVTAAAQFMVDKEKFAFSQAKRWR